MKNKIILIVVLVVVAIIAIFFLIVKKDPPQTIVDTEAVEYGSLTNSVTATGTVDPVTEVEVGTQVSGTVKKLYVDYNDRVKKGQLLAELDRSTLTSTLNAAKTDYEIALNEFKYYEKVYNRNKALHDKSLISDSEFEEVEYQYIRAKNSVTKSKYEVEKATTNLGYATIYCPIDGVVISVEVEEGQTVTATMTTPTLFQIAENLEDMEVVANIDEADIGEVKEGQEVVFTVDAYPNDQFRGTVRQVRLQATTTSNVVTYEVIVDAKNPDLKLKPGLTANISIYTLKLDSVITVPTKALRFKMEEQLLPPKMVVKPLQEPAKQSVWVVVQDSIAEERAIVAGVNNGTRTQVLSGVNIGERVIVSSVETESLDASEIKQEDGGQSPFMPKRPGQNKKRNK